MISPRHRPLLAAAAGALIAILALIGGASAQPASAPSLPPGAPNPEDVLRHFVLEGEIPTQPLPKIGVVPSLDSKIEDVTLNAVVKRDLDLSGEFEVLTEQQIPEGLYLSDSPVDVDAWKKKGAESVVKVSARLTGNTVELRAQAFLTSFGDKAVYDEKFSTSKKEVRQASHRVADAIIGALTGTPGGFSSQMTFVYGVGKQRRVYVMDGDGHDPHPVSPADHLALAPVFGPSHELYYSASVNRGAFKVFPDGATDPLTIQPRGSIYGLAWNRDGSEVAVSIARGSGINLFRGPDLSNLTAASNSKMALRPAWSPSGKLAFAGEGKWGQRIYVDGKPVTPAGLNATAPDFCRHPNGIRLVYMVWLGEQADLVAMNESGGGAYRLTAGSGKNGYPACSPDGRLIAYFTDRKTGQGPGLYIMRVDGRRPKRVSTLVGDSLRWARLPEPGTKKKSAAKASPAAGKPTKGPAKASPKNKKQTKK